MAFELSFTKPPTMLAADNHLAFLKSKIEELNTAVFKADINSVIAIPNNIITTMQVDDEGGIWFYTSCNSNYKKQIDKQFYAYLEYYHKGSGSKLRVSGNATVMEEENAVKRQESTSNNRLLVHLKIMHAEYIAYKPEVYNNWLDKIKSTFYNWLFLNTEEKFDFS